MLAAMLERVCRVGFLVVDDVVVTFGGVRALDGASFAVEVSQICGLIGPNGAGKTSLFNVISGLYRPDAGRVSLAGQDILALPANGVARAGIARTFQNLGLFASQSVLENVMLGAYHRTRAGFLGGMLRLPAATREGRRIRDEALAILDLLGLSRYADHPAQGLPFGTLKRVELGRALAAHPRLLMLDEPANGLTHGEVAEFGELILQLREELRLTVLLVEHHMGLVMGVSDTVVALNFGRKIAEGTPDEVRQNDDLIAAYLGTAA